MERKKSKRNEVGKIESVVLAMCASVILLSVIALGVLIPSTTMFVSILVGAYLLHRFKR